MANFAFFGSPWFAAIILDKLIAGGFVPSVVVCNPDRPVGRKQLLTAPAVKQLIANRKEQIEILQPERLDPSLFAIRHSPNKNNKFDVFIVATYAKIISKEVFALPRLGTIGIHHSLLPLHRGPTPIQSAILAGDEETGTTLFLMDEKIDHGSIIAQRKVQIGNHTYMHLEQELAEMSGELLVKTLPDFLAGKVTPISQDESKATYTKKFITQDAFIDEKDLIRTGGRLSLPSGKAKPSQIDEELASFIERKIRALNPEPGTWTETHPVRFDLKNSQGRTLGEEKKRIKLLDAELRDGKLILKKIQVEGEKPKDIS
ncbi:MAG: methionyl-tRNA formyltransferase [Candidatus Liptonbacteria bacterium]|nr:methionyl-tRNA formyltransferase [Candidatus Liptonbacteria bacterium]